MASVLLSALGALTGQDMWEAAQSCHEMFDRGGYFYNKVWHDLGPLKPNQHCTLPFFPNKVCKKSCSKRGGSVSGLVVNTSNSVSGGPKFKSHPLRCFLRQGTLLHFVSLQPGV